MNPSDDRNAEREQANLKARRREARNGRIRDIAWTAAIASVAVIIVVTATGWLTTQSVVEEAREAGARETMTLRSDICVARFQQRPDSDVRLAEFKDLNWRERETTVRQFVVDHRLATMLGEDAPAAGAVNGCASAILRT